MARRLPAAPLLAGVIALQVACTASAGSAEDLLSGLRVQLLRPQARCERIAPSFARSDLTLSLYREELANLYLAIDGARAADSASGGIARAVFEIRQSGPASAELTLELPRTRLPALSASGHVVEVGFEDRSRSAHPLFCGVLGLLQPDATGRRAELVALVPRSGGELQSSAGYTDVTEVDVIQSLARAANLGLLVQDTEPRQKKPAIVRDAVATWPFMRSLADRLRMDLVLRPDRTLALTAGTFAPPPAAPVRDWTRMTWVKIATEIASDAGRVADAEFTRRFDAISTQQTTDDDDFVADLAARNLASAWWSPGRLVLRDDGAWLPDAAARTAPAVQMTPWQLAEQVASRHQLALRTPQIAGPIVLVNRRNETDAELLVRIAGASGLRPVVRGTDLYLFSQGAPGDVPDVLLRRLTIAGSASGGRRFLRRHADPARQLADPERVATTEVLLDVGAALPAVTAPAAALGDMAATAAALDAAINRLAARPELTPADRFLLEVARVYRPTLVHLYRLRPDGAKALNAL